MKRDGKHCRRGHPYTAETLHFTTRGVRRCRICESLWRRRHYRVVKGTEATRVNRSRWSEYAE